MEKTIITNPNNMVALICEKNNNKNNTYTLIPIEISLGKLDEDGFFISEDKSYVLEECTCKRALKDTNTKYVYALCTPLDEIKSKYDSVSELGILLALYYQEISSSLLIVETNKDKAKLYLADYKSLEQTKTKEPNKKINEDGIGNKKVNVQVPSFLIKKDDINLPELERYVKERVLENDEIVEDICTTIALNYSAENPKEMQSLLSIGSTGTGKTETYRAISEYIGIPLIIYDCDSLTAVGYVGDDIKDILKEIYAKSNNDIKVAERSILLLDEIDKLAATGHHVTDIAGQQLLLKFYDGGTYTFEPIKNGSKVSMDVSFITKAASGAFPALFERRSKNNNMGFISNNSETIYSDIPSVKELEQFGMMKELIGRWQNIFVYKNHTEESLRNIIENSKNSPLLLKQLRYLREFNCELIVDQEFTKAFANMALKDERGARCLDSLMAKTFKRLDRELKLERDLTGANVKRKVLIDESLIHNPNSFKI